ncbi:MAG: twin-arginine translocation signal domain-containing protein, partial [Candidatus Nanohalobium sp.]
MSDEDIEKLIERKVEEKIDKKRKEVREEVKEELGVSESGEDKQEEEETGLSRRSFLKMLGVGAGSLALSSSAAGIEWSVLQPSSQGTSGVEAKKATMGSAPFQLLGDLEAKDGELIWDESNSYIPASSINQSGISHDNISNVSADDHHPEVSAGTNISVDSSNTVSVSPQGKGSS